MSKKVYILGIVDFTKSLMVQVLQSETGYPCSVIRNPEPLAGADGSEEDSILVLADHEDPQTEKNLLDLKNLIGLGGPEWVVALYKVPTGALVEQVALMRGIRGFFYTTDKFFQGRYVGRFLVASPSFPF